MKKWPGMTWEIVSAIAVNLSTKSKSHARHTSVEPTPEARSILWEIARVPWVVSCSRVGSAMMKLAPFRHPQTVKRRLWFEEFLPTAEESRGQIERDGHDGLVPLHKSS